MKVEDESPDAHKGSLNATFKMIQWKNKYFFNIQNEIYGILKLFINNLI